MPDGSDRQPDPREEKLRECLKFRGQAQPSERDVAEILEHLDAGRSDDAAVALGFAARELPEGAAASIISELTSEQPEPEDDGMVSQCFIATAACGSPDHPLVRVLREYRDSVLMTWRVGRLAVRWYCRLSPPIAKAIRHRRILAPLVRWFVVKPAARWAAWVLGRR